MNYLLAILFIVSTSLISNSIKKSDRRISGLNYKRYAGPMFAGTAVLIAMSMAQFVLIANGIQRLSQL